MSQDGREGDSAHMSKATLVGGNSDVPVEDLVIFSAPAVKLVILWWAESNRRWAERNRFKAPTA